MNRAEGPNHVQRVPHRTAFDDELNGTRWALVRHLESLVLTGGDGTAT